MEVTTLDEDAVADDAVLRDYYDVTRRAQLFGREQAPYRTFEEFCGAIRSQDSGERQELFVAHDGRRLVGTAILWSFLLDNVDKSVVSVAVDPPARRRGAGRALLAHAERLASQDGRALIMADSKIPFAERDTHGYRSFATACGYDFSNVEVVRHLALPVPDDRIQAWVDEAAPSHEGYVIETLVDDVPDDLAASLCVLLGQLGVDAPTGAVDFEEEAMTPDRLVERLATVRAMNRSLYETVALTPDRLVVAHSTLAVPLGESRHVYQWGTFVHREHRGHRLGLATKAANLRAAQRARADLTLVTTQNAETNDYMVSINERMGFEPVEVSVEFVKAL